MLNKDSDEGEKEIGGIIKKVIIGAAFLLILPIAVPAITGVDIVKLCTTDAEGDCEALGDSNDTGTQGLRDSFEKITPLFALLLDIFFIVIGVAILFGPGKQLIAYRYVKDYDASSS